MSFEDELKELILNKQAEDKRRDEELTNSRNAWQTTKLNIVKPALEQAVKALETYSRFGATVELRNGSIRLKLTQKQNPRPPIPPVTHELTFSLNEAKREVECVYRKEHLVLESFTLDNLDQRTVESKIKEFLSAALGE